MNSICVAIVHAYSLVVLGGSHSTGARRHPRQEATSPAAEPAGEGCRANIITTITLNMAKASA